MTDETLETRLDCRRQRIIDMDPETAELLREALATLRQREQALEEEWRSIKTAPRDRPLWLYSASLVHADFNPSGVVEGYWQDDEGWIAAIWNNEQDCWDATIVKPTHWREMRGPNGKPSAEALATLRQREQALEEAEGELRTIDAVLARRPALDRPTRWQNIEKAITHAARADEAERKLAAAEATVAALTAEREKERQAIRGALIAGRNALAKAVYASRGGISTKMDDVDHAFAAFDIAMTKAFAVDALRAPERSEGK